MHYMKLKLGTENSLEVDPKSASTSENRQTQLELDASTEQIVWLPGFQN